MGTALITQREAEVCLYGKPLFECTHWDIRRFYMARPELARLRVVFFTTAEDDDDMRS